MYVSTIKALKKAIQDLPDDMPVEGWDGTDGNDLPVSVDVVDYKAEGCADRQDTILLITVSH